MNTSQHPVENTLPQPLRATRQLCYASYFGLLALYAGLNLSAETFSFTGLAIQWVPLLLPLWGMLKDTHRSYNWLCFVVLAYFLFIVPNAMSEQAGWSDWLQLLLTCVLFISAMLVSRWLQAWQYHIKQLDGSAVEEANDTKETD